MTTIPASNYDYIIVGAGSAGCVVAARLSENPAIRVCLLEAGGRDTHPLIHIPFGLSMLSRLQTVNWHYHTMPQPELNNRALYWPRGKTLGGSSSINAMCYIRGQYSDFDDWEAAGASGWSAREVIPWFKKAENFCGGADEYHGEGGPLQVNELRHADPLSHTFIKAAGQADLPPCTDFNRQQRIGAGLYHVTQHNGQRWSSARAYLGEAQARQNLDIRTQVQVNKINITEGIATGVQIQSESECVNLTARREVIVCAGAVNTPQLLMLSGVGPGEELARHTIPVVCHRPGVGQNLQDHLDVIVQCKGKTHDGYAIAPTAIPRYLKASIDYLLHRNGLLCSNIAEAGGFACSSNAATNKPDLQFHFLPARLKDHGRKTSFGYGYGLHVCNLYPRSRGQITLQSADPALPPQIDPGYLKDKQDLQVMLEGIRLARKILQAPAFAPYFKSEWLPGDSCQSDTQLTEFIRQRAETIYHPVGTCKMGHGEDPNTVVDNRLQVIGVKGLRVADASVMPTITGGNTHAPVVMIAERAAAFILQDYAPSQAGSHALPPAGAA
ncbi:choline dehydrogenase [Salinimonas marina]|uniref:Choline dehydrogenase n=1 Tax=Salinimonas marina TaxID=2785918 RepID=A0A7S9E0A0_9ALTE|nr:choline dehydrogenase [Salinimonas marina]QPG06670.1 choline dehydrogenase [Salinimonas marina]